MTVRLLLVALVVGLGMDFARMESWAERGEVASAMPNGTDAFAAETSSSSPPAARMEVVAEKSATAVRPAMIEVVDLEILDVKPVAAIDPDADFRNVVDNMTVAFAADLAPVAEVQLAIVQDEASDDIDPALAGLPGYAEAENPSATEPTSASEMSRLAEAIRLTGQAADACGQAADAWANLLR